MHEFEGKTVEEAIQKAVDELNLSLSNFDVEVLEEKKGLFGTTRYARVRISESTQMQSLREKEPITANSPEEKEVIEFIHTLLHYFDVAGKAEIQERREDSIDIAIHSSNPSFLIGKNGNTFDALQTIISAAARGLQYDKRVFIDIEQYRMRQQQRIVSQVKKIVQQVRQTNKSVVMQPMNPQQRRVVHQAVTSLKGVATKSLGDDTDFIKQIEIYISSE